MMHGDENYYFDEVSCFINMKFKKKWKNIFELRPKNTTRPIFTVTLKC